MNIVDLKNKIVGLRNNGMKWSAIAEELNKEGITPIQQNRNKYWYANLVSSFVLNYNKTKNDHPRLPKEKLDQYHILISMIKQQREKGKSNEQIAKFFKKEGIKHPRNTKWTRFIINHIIRYYSYLLDQPSVSEAKPIASENKVPTVLDTPSKEVSKDIPADEIVYLHTKLLKTNNIKNIRYWFEKRFKTKLTDEILKCAISMMNAEELAKYEKFQKFNDVEKEIIEMYKSGKTCNNIANELNHKNIRTINGCLWCTSNVYYVINKLLPENEIRKIKNLPNKSYSIPDNIPEEVILEVLNGQRLELSTGSIAERIKLKFGINFSSADVVTILKNSYRNRVNTEVPNIPEKVVEKSEPIAPCIKAVHICKCDKIADNSANYQQQLSRKMLDQLMLDMKDSVVSYLTVREENGNVDVTITFEN